jgi:hypothetical protein
MTPLYLIRWCKHASADEYDEDLGIGQRGNVVPEYVERVVERIGDFVVLEVGVAVERFADL